MIEIEFMQTYFYAKTIAEKTAFEFAENNGLDLISVIPTLVNGPFLMSTMPPSMLTALALITSMLILLLLLIFTSKIMQIKSIQINIILS